MRRRLSNVLDAISQLLNCLLLPNAHDTDANETISGRAYRAGWTRTERVINALWFWAEDHCRGAHRKDVSRAAKLLREQQQ